MQAIIVPLNRGRIVVHQFANNAKFTIRQLSFAYRIFDRSIERFSISTMGDG